VTASLIFQENCIISIEDLIHSGGGHLNNISLDELKALVQFNSDVCDAVSIFTPTYKTGADKQQNSLNLERLLAQAASQLLSTSFKRAADAHNYLYPVKQLLSDQSLWDRPSNGLAVFLHRDYFRYYTLPQTFDEYVTVNYRFSIRPLVPLFTSRGKFYVLALSQNSVRFLECNHDEIRRIHLEGIVPGSMAQAMLPEKNERTLTTHTGAQGKGKEGSVFSGQGPENVEKDNIALYFQQINKGLTQKVLRGETAPLVVAGVNYLHPMYKKANTYLNLLQIGIEGNPDKLSDADLGDRAASVLTPLFETEKTNALTEYRELAGTGHTTRDIQDIVAKSYAGQIERLLITGSSHTWGTFDPADGSVVVHPKAKPCDYDLVDFAAANTLFHGGSAYTVRPEEMPGDTDIGAILRHEAHLPKFGHPGKSTKNSKHKA
jgi:hypothetical protein